MEPILTSRQQALTPARLGILKERSIRGAFPGLSGSSASEWDRQGAGEGPPTPIAFSVHQT